MAEDRTRQTAAKLHTAGPNFADRDIRLDLPGPAAYGTSRSKESDADRSWVERVDGGGYGEPNRDGPGSTKMYPSGRVALFMAMSHVTVVTVGIPHRSETALYKGSVASEPSPL